MFSITSNNFSFNVPTLSAEVLASIDLDDLAIWIKSGETLPSGLKNRDQYKLSTKPDYQIRIEAITPKDGVPSLLLSFVNDRYPLCEVDQTDPELFHLVFIEPELNEELVNKINLLLTNNPNLQIGLEAFWPYTAEEYTVWDKRLFKIAEEVSSWSKDPGTKVGCVLVGYNKRILSTGYNGFPAGFNDNLVSTMNREKKLAFTIHAEINSIINAAKNGVDIEGATAYITFHPCTNCISSLINAGITTIFCPDYNCFRPNPNGHFSFQTWLTNFKRAQDFLIDDMEWTSTVMDHTFIKYAERYY